MLRHQYQKPLQNIVGDPLTDTTRSSHQARLTLTPLRVPCLYPAGLATALVARLVLTRTKRGEEPSVRPPMICAHRLGMVVLGHVRPDKRQHLIRSIPEGKAQYLSHQTRDGYPEPEGGREAHTDLVHLDDIFFGRRHGGQAGRLLYPLCPFLRTARMVSRLTWRARAIPLWEVRSASERRICCCFSGVRARLLGASVKVFLQALQRHLGVPERLVPKRMTPSTS